MNIFRKLGARAALLKGGHLPALAEANQRALEGRPCLAPDWKPRAVGVHHKVYEQARAAFPYFGEVLADVTGAPPVRMLHHDDDMVAAVCFLFGRDSYEPLSLHLFARLSAGTDGAVLDIGAFTGLFGLVAAGAAPEAVVISFEPAPHIAARAALNGRLNGYDNYRVEAAAVSDITGRRALTYYGGTSATTGASLAPKSRDAVGEEEVEVTTIDTSAAMLDRPVMLIKLDTEGDEMAALAGGAEILRRDRPVVLSEVLNDAAVAGQCGAMADHGYSAVFIDDAARRLIPVDAAFSLKGRGFGNLLFTPDEAVQARASSIAEAFRQIV
ncbi:MAG: FkbM family methyltransferase [Pseudomonadota bacterium]